MIMKLTAIIGHFLSSCSFRFMSDHVTPYLLRTWVGTLV
jgi:hypothetical protein